MREPQVDPTAVDAVLTASRSMVAVATRSLDAAAEETTIAQYRALVVLASRGARRMAGLAEALDVAASTAGRSPPRGPGLGDRGRPAGGRRGDQPAPRSDRGDPGTAAGARAAGCGA